MNEPNDKKQRQFDAFRRFIMPALGVAEAIATQGKSPGTTALAVEQNYQNAEDRQQQFRRQAEEDAIRRKLTGVQLESAGREKSKYEAEEGRRAEYEAGIDRIPDLTDIERLMLRRAEPQEGIRYLVEKGKPDLARELLASRLASQEKQTGQRIESAEEIAGKRIDAGGEKEKTKKEEAEKSGTELKNEVLSLVDEIRNDPGFATGLNPKRLLSKVPGSPEFAFMKKVENLKARLSLDQRSKLKGQGQISDFEAKMLEKAVSMLDLGLGKDAFMKELDRIGGVMEGRFKEEGESGTGTRFNPNPPPPASSGQSKFTIKAVKKAE